LLKALAEPDVHARAALDALLHTRFVHRIDAPSLSLVMPLLLRGLRERSTFAKRCAAQIAGNMTTLAEYDDLHAYLDKLLPAVRDVLFDPVPDSRATAAHALGLLAAPLAGSAPYRALLPWLRTKMRCNEGSVERAGAAQVRVSFFLSISAIVHFLTNHNNNKGIGSCMCRRCRR
jgi:hypothetical protein